MGSQKIDETQRIAGILDVLNLSIESLPFDVQEKLNTCADAMEGVGLDDPDSAKMLSVCAKKMLKQIADINCLTSSRSLEFDLKKSLTGWNDLSKQLEKDIGHHEHCPSSSTTSSSKDVTKLLNYSENELMNKPHVKLLELKRTKISEVTKSGDDIQSIDNAKELLKMELEKRSMLEQEINSLIMRINPNESF